MKTLSKTKKTCIKGPGSLRVLLDPRSETPVIFSIRHEGVELTATLGCFFGEGMTVEGVDLNEEQIAFIHSIESQINNWCESI